MNLLLNTHTFLWMSLDDPQLVFVMVSGGVESMPLHQGGGSG